MANLLIKPGKFRRCFIIPIIVEDCNSSTISRLTFLFRPHLLKGAVNERIKRQVGDFKGKGVVLRELSSSNTRTSLISHWNNVRCNTSATYSPSWVCSVEPN